MPVLFRGVALSCVAYALVVFVGVLAVASNGWFGSSDLIPYAVFCIPFAFFLWGGASMFFWLARAWPSTVASTTGFALGIVVGFVGTFTVAIFLGPWFGAMSVPMLQTWCVAASVYIPAVYLIQKSGLQRPAVVGSGAYLSLGVGLFIGFSPIWSLITGDQHLKTAFFRHIPGEGALEIISAPDWLTNEDRELILSSGLTGTLEARRSGGSNSTDWPRAKALVIFTAEMSTSVRLAQPKRTTVLYIQGAQEFIKLPEDAPTYDRAIEFYERARGWGFWVEHASGSKSGGGLRFLDELSAPDGRSPH